MFYLKYRPKKVEEIDNTRAREVIEKILSTKNKTDFPHAYLLVGQKGTGKTSTARILSKAVNCLQNSFAGKGSSFEPCGVCDNCKSIDNASSVDVVEMDAASNRGIEEVKSLIRDTAFLPMHNRYKVFIIDEAHMITTEAFNALLKTLEEPPPSTVFILATTNAEKIPTTISSRCQIINFGRAKKEEIVLMLQRIAKAEKLDVKDEVLELISKRSDHSFRDATKLLEELVIQKKLTFLQAQEFLGIIGKSNFLEVLDTKSLKDALTWVNEFEQSGGNFKSLIEDNLNELRLYLLKKSGVSREEPESNMHFSLVEVSTLMKLLSKAHNDLKITPIEALPLEIAVADFYNGRKR